jgi:hypothetical protein
MLKNRKSLFSQVEVNASSSPFRAASPAARDEFIKSCIADLAPEGVLENELAHSIASQIWRMHQPGFPNHTRQRNLQNALRLFRALRERRLKPKAILQLPKPSVTYKEIGFVRSNRNNVIEFPGPRKCRTA